MANLELSTLAYEGNDPHVREYVDKVNTEARQRLAALDDVADEVERDRQATQVLLDLHEEARALLSLLLKDALSEAKHFRHERKRLEGQLKALQGERTWLLDRVKVLERILDEKTPVHVARQKFVLRDATGAIDRLVETTT
jgi:DNA repair exonuclease SbcCD ATPase subunit